ncbi:MAG: PASTA domain-containing protein [Clostridiales bacterium]|nr:PASTA domain-containing protein [Clostridiales bacterium]
MLNEYNVYSLRKRIFALIIAVSFIFLLLTVRLFYLQAIKAENLQNKALSQWVRDLPITAERGKIYDCNGAALAVSYTTYNVYTRYREIKDVNQVALFLSKKLNMKYNEVFEKITKHNVSEVLIKLKIEQSLAEEILEGDMPGIFLSENVTRYYPYGDLLTQVVGFTSIDNVGQAGLEAYFQDTLAGDDGYYMVQSDLQGKEIDNTLRTYIPTTAGDDVKLSIDVNFQIILEQVMKKAYEEQKAKGVTGMIMNAKTGEILAMSNKPSFDLNQIPRDNVSALMETVKNKCVVDVYEPGSTFKILTMAAALECGVAKLSDHFYCGGSMTVDGQRIKCWKSIGHGSISLSEGFAVSCNCVFMTLAQRLGTQRFYEYLKKFGIGEKTGIEISGESKGIMLNEKFVKTVDLARIGFGQTIAVTPIQLLTAISTIIGGNKINPSILAQEQNNQTRVVSENTSNIICEMMKLVVNKTAKYSFVPGYDVGGKTGTAQKYENGSIARGKYISSFIGTYPASNPQYVLLFAVDEPSAGAYYGSVVAAPYGKEIFANLFTYLNIQPTNLEEDLKQIEKTIKMPNLIGKSLTEAISILNNLGLIYEIDGEGGIIKDQLPPAGTMLFKDANVILIT